MCSEVPQKSKQFSLFLAVKAPQTIFCFEKYLFSDPRFISYHLPVGNTHMDYLPKENVAVKNSCLRVSLTLGHLLALPAPGWEKPLSVVEWWGLERRWARWSSLRSLWHPLLLSIAPFFTTSEAADNQTCSEREGPLQIFNSCLFIPRRISRSQRLPYMYIYNYKI